MTDALYEKVKAYKASMSVIKELRKKRLLTPSEYRKIRKKLAQKYGLSNYTIFIDTT